MWEGEKLELLFLRFAFHKVRLNDENTTLHSVGITVGFSEAKEFFLWDNKDPLHSKTKVKQAAFHAIAKELREEYPGLCQLNGGYYFHY